MENVNLSEQIRRIQADLQKEIHALEDLKRKIHKKEEEKRAEDLKLQREKQLDDKITEELRLLKLEESTLLANRAKLEHEVRDFNTQLTQLNRNNPHSK